MQFHSANVFGGLNLARAVLPGMRARKEGTILWNGSLLGIKPGVGVGIYGATKASVRGLFLSKQCFSVFHMLIYLFQLESNIASLT